MHHGSQVCQYMYGVSVGLFCACNRSLLPYDRPLLTLTHTRTSARFAAAVACRWPQVAASPLPSPSPTTPEVARGGKGQARKRSLVDKMQQMQMRKLGHEAGDTRQLTKRASATAAAMASPSERSRRTTPALSPAARSGGGGVKGVVGVGGKSGQSKRDSRVATANAYLQGIGKEKRVNR